MFSALNALKLYFRLAHSSCKTAEDKPQFVTVLTAGFSVRSTVYSLLQTGVTVIHSNIHTTEGSYFEGIKRIKLFFKIPHSKQSILDFF